MCPVAHNRIDKGDAHGRHVGHGFGKATGGLAGCVTPFCRREIRYEPDLLLIGLAVLWEKNRSGKKA